MSKRPLRIGLSARIYHPQPGATGICSRNRCNTLNSRSPTG
jgi:putative glutamine amidotransferase